MNVAFFGTSNRSIPILNSLKNSNYNLALCITKPDVKVGRKQILKPTAVKVWAEENRVDFVTTDSLKPGTTEHIKTALVERNVELGIVADFSFIIPEEIFELPKHKILNIHFSLLPKYRGASPVQFAILNQDNVTGISYQVIVRAMDAGPLIHQSEHELLGTETTEFLYTELFEKAGKELPKVIEKYISGDFNVIHQEGSEITYTYSPSHPKSTHIFKEDAEINWDTDIKTIDASVRAFNPWPIAWTTLDKLCNYFGKECTKNPELRVKIYKTNIKNNELFIEEIQVEGKNKQSFEDFKNGYLK